MKMTYDEIKTVAADLNKEDVMNGEVLESAVLAVRPELKDDSFELNSAMLATMINAHYAE